MLTVFDIKVLETPTDELDTLVLDFESDIGYVQEELDAGVCADSKSELQLLQKKLAAVRQEIDNRRTPQEKYLALFA